MAIITTVPTSTSAFAIHGFMAKHRPFTPVKQKCNGEDGGGGGSWRRGGKQVRSRGARGGPLAGRDAAEKSRRPARQATIASQPRKWREDLRVGNQRKNWEERQTPNLPP